MTDLRLANAIVLPSGACSYCDNDAESIFLGYGSKCPVCGHDYAEERRLQNDLDDLQIELDEANEAITKLEEKLGKEAQAVDSDPSVDAANGGVPDGDKA